MKRLIVSVVAMLLVFGFSGCSGKSAEDVSAEFEKQIENLKLENKLGFIINEPQNKFMKHQNLAQYIEDLFDGYIQNGAKINEVVEAVQGQENLDTQFKKVSGAVGVIGLFGSKNMANMILMVIQVHNMGEAAIGKMITKKEAPNYEKQYQQIINSRYGKYFDLGK
jgi:hypothetical protein